MSIPFKVLTIHVHDQDLYALYNFRYRLLQKLKENYRLKIFCKFDYFGGSKKYFSKFNVVSPLNDKIGMLGEVFLKIRSYNERPEMHIVFGLRTAVLTLLIPLFFGRREGKYIIIVPGLGRAGGFPPAILQIVGKLFYKYSHAIVLLNNHDRKKLALPICSKVTVVPSEGINLNNNDKTDLSKKRNFKKLLYIGRIISEKGIFQLIDRIPDGFELDIYGYGPDSVVNELLHKLIQKPNVNFLGKTSAPLEIMSHYKYCVFPSSYNEGFPIAILECISVGCVPIPVKIPQLEHIFTHIPELSYLNRNFNVLELEAIIINYEAHPEKMLRLSKKMFGYLSEFHSRDVFSNHIELIVHSLNNHTQHGRVSK